MSTPLERAAVPPLFFTIEKRKGMVSQYASPGAYIHVLSNLEELFGVTKYQFDKILGLFSHAGYYAYFNGHSRPSAAILARAMMVRDLSDAGSPIHRMVRIDWESDPIEILWRDGSTSSPSPITGAWTATPKPSAAS